VGDLPEFLESESNSTFEKAEPVKLPVTVNGQINGERDIDHFRFHAPAGKIVTFEVLAGRLGSRLDPIVELLDESGNLLDVQEVLVGIDPVLAYRAEKSTDVILRISNVTHHGDPSYVYRINVTTKPFAHFAFPAGGQAGAKRQLDFYTLTGDGTYQVQKKTVTFPAGQPGEFQFHDAETISNSVLLSTSNIPNRLEVEPNNSQATAMDASLPTTIDGRLFTASDSDWYRISASAKDRLTILCNAYPPGTPALPVIRLRDSTGKELKESASVQDNDQLCQIEFTAPNSGQYFLEVRDLQFGARGGPEFIYRLSIQQARKDFSLSIPNDSYTVLQGKDCKITVNVKRFGGFDGPIELALAEQLPAGLSFKPKIIPAKKNSQTLTITADDNVPVDDFVIELSGQATIDEKLEIRGAQSKHLGTDSEGVSIGANRLNRFHLTVAHKPIFRLFCPEAYLYANRGSIFPYPMELERLNGFTGKIIMQIGDRQNRDLDGIEMIETTIPSATSKFFLPIYLPETMHINVQSQSQLYSQAYAFFKDTQGREQSVLVLSEKRNMLRTLPPVVKLNAVDDVLTAKAGGQVSCKLKLERTTNFPGPMQLTLQTENPNLGIGMAETTIAAGQTEISVSLKLGSSLEPGQTVPVNIRATGKLNNKYTVITEAKFQLVLQ